MILLLRSYLSIALLIVTALLSSHICSGEAAETVNKHTWLDLQYERTAVVFDLWELRVPFMDYLRELEPLPATQVNDAYDADRDGVYARLTAEFTDDDRRRIVVPGFAMKEKPDGPWLWCVRWSPRAEGAWNVRLRFEGRAEATGRKLIVDHILPTAVVAETSTSSDGPLIATGRSDNPGYLRRLLPDGTSEAVWLFGACRAWVLRSEDPEAAWYPNEAIDREKELFAPMREGGFNLLNQWMAPWEYLVVHHDRAEFWEQPDGTFTRVPLSEKAEWTTWQYYDQGRSLAFDGLVRQCEGGDDRSTIYMLLSPMSHQSLQMKEHPWGSQESGWSPEDDTGTQTLERLNGFSGFRPNMTVWEFFEADPTLPLDDWRSQLFDHQANYFRYVIARWGHSRAIGLWVIIDELDAIGDDAGSMSQKTGWWEHPECETWLANMIRMFRGELTRSDGLRYAGDPFHHPLHAATTSYGGEIEAGANVEWDGGPRTARPDVPGWHWYPSWQEGMTWNDAWAYAIAGIGRFAKVLAGKRAGLISEFGSPDRDSRDMLPSPLYPTLYHHAIWAAVFSGQAGTPMDWDDGKEFGELRWRHRKGDFDRDHYPIDHVAQMKALRMFLGDATPEHLHSCLHPDAPVKCVSKGSTQIFALYSSENPGEVLGWLFSPENEPEFGISGLPTGTYELTWYDPWTGTAVPGIPAETLKVTDGKPLPINSQRVFARLRAGLVSFPGESRQDKGKDAAFKLRRK